MMPPRHSRLHGVICHRVQVHLDVISAQLAQQNMDSEELKCVNNVMVTQH